MFSAPTGVRERSPSHRLETRVIQAPRLTTMLPAMPLAEALTTTHIHRVAGRTGARTTLVTTRPCRAPPQTISDVGVLGRGPVPLPGEGSRRTTASCSSTSCPSAHAMSWKCCGIIEESVL